MFGLGREDFDSLAENIVYKKLKLLERELGAIVILHPKIKRRIISYLTADIAVVHGNFGVILCEVNGIRNEDLEKIVSIDKGKIKFSSGKKIDDPWEQVRKYQNNFIKKIDGKYYISKKVILPYLSSAKFKEFSSEMYDLYKDDTLFKEEIDNANFEKLFLGIPTYVSLSKDDIKELCESFGHKLEEEKLKDVSVYKLTTPQGIFYYDKKVVSILKNYKGGLKIIRGLAGTGKTITLLHFILYKTSELKKENKKVGIFCFNIPLYEYLKDMVKELGLMDLVEIRRIGYSSNIYFPYEEFKYVLIDEFQDFPEDIGQNIIKNHKNIIIFADETQKIYDEGFTSWKKVLKEKYQPGLLNNYLRIVYRNPTDIYKCGLELLSNDKKLKGYKKVQEVIKNSDSINEIGGLTFYDDFDNLIEEIKKFAKNLKKERGYILKIGLLVNTSGKNEKQKELEFAKYFSGLDFDVKSYLRVKGLEYDFIILKDFWTFLNYYKEKFPSYLYRMVYTIITRAKFGVFIPYPDTHQIKDKDLEKVYEILKKFSKKHDFNELLTKIDNKITTNIDDEIKKDKSNFSLVKTTLYLIELLANIKTIYGG